MRYAIADPPYLGRAVQHYGAGANGRPMWGASHGLHLGRAHLNRTTEHPDAAAWDDPAAHAELVAELVERFDGWAVALARDSLPTYLAAAPADARVACWHRPDGTPSGSRIRSCWEPVLIYVPPDRRGRSVGAAISDVLTAGSPNIGHTGAKPQRWTRWVLNMLGVTDQDTVTDLFPGSGLVAAELAQTVLDLGPGW